MIEQVLADLRREEGWRPHVYADSLGFATIGYGFLVDERKGGGIPKDVADFWLAYKVNQIVGELESRWPPFRAQEDDIRRGLIQAAYQLGVDGLLGFRLALSALERGDRETAAENFIASRWHEQTRDRCERVADLIRGHRA